MWKRPSANHLADHCPLLSIHNLPISIHEGIKASRRLLNLLGNQLQNPDYVIPEWKITYWREVNTNQSIRCIKFRKLMFGFGLLVHVVISVFRMLVFLHLDVILCWHLQIILLGLDLHGFVDITLYSIICS